MSLVKTELTELRSMSETELQQELIKLRKSQFILRLKRKTEGNLDKSHTIMRLRKRIARIKTLLVQSKGGQND